MSKLDSYLKQISEAGFTSKPKGWTDKSIKKYSKTFTKKMKGGVKDKGFFDKCVKKMQGKMENPEGYCASLKDEAYGSTYWRGKDKSKKEVSKDVAAHKNVKENTLIENFLQHLYTDNRPQAKEWRGANIPVGDDSNRTNLVRQCMTLESDRQKINCLRKLRDQAAMNPFYQHRLDRFVDAITGYYEPTVDQGTIPGSEFKPTAVGEDLKEGYLQEGTSNVVKYKGKTFKVDEGGHLLNPNSYSMVWVEYACKKLGIKKITPEHMKVINFVRTYFHKNNAFPMIRVIEKVTHIDLKNLYRLFPAGPIKSLTLIVGVPHKEAERLNA